MCIKKKSMSSPILSFEINKKDYLRYVCTMTSTCRLSYHIEFLFAYDYIALPHTPDSLVLGSLGTLVLSTYCSWTCTCIEPYWAHINQSYWFVLILIRWLIMVGILSYPLILYYYLGTVVI